MADLLSMFEELDRHVEPENREQIVRAPFGYPGGKSRSIAKILPHLPYSEIYVEPFGGSAAILLARHKSKLEVFNDRYAGVVAFYRCLRNPEKYKKMVNWLELTVHAREEFAFCKETWENCEDDVERAARWYLMTSQSFGSLGRNFGRSTSSRSTLASIRDKLTLFPTIHQRLQKVQVENQDWYQCLMDYDSRTTVFYCDPPYVDADTGIYKNKMDRQRHKDLIDTVFSLKGFVAVSGYANPLYGNQPWDDKIQWDVPISIKSIAYTDTNHKGHLEGVEERGSNTECLWIKEAQP